MKTITFEYGPKRLHLYFNGNAMFEVDALDDGIAEDAPEALERMQAQNAEGYLTLCKIAHILATQGELSRRLLQYTPERIPTVDELLLVLTPRQMLSLRSAVLRAISEGFSGSDDGEDSDIDTGLAELEKKTKL